MNSNIKILIVDDDPDLLFAAARVIRPAGYEVLTASTAGHCMEIVKNKRPDLILLDVVLPDADGQTLCRQIKADPALKNLRAYLHF